MSVTKMTNNQQQFNRRNMNPREKKKNIAVYMYVCYVEVRMVLKWN